MPQYSCQDSRHSEGQARWWTPARQQQIIGQTLNILKTRTARGEEPPGNAIQLQRPLSQSKYLNSTANNAII